MTQTIRRLLGNAGIPLAHAYPLQSHTAYKVGGEAEVAAFPRNLNQLIHAAAVCRSKGIPFYLLGGGANVIIADEGLPGVTILTNGCNRIRLMGGILEAECGVTLEQLAMFAASRGIDGFVFLYDIPGSVGGSLIMNAGNNQGEMKEICTRIRVLDRENRLREFRGGQAGFGYRTSYFKKNGCLILSAQFRASGRQPAGRLLMKNEEIRRQRWGRFPMEFPNGGSVFKRPPGDFAGRLIEAAGCGGMRVGDAELSRKHHGFIVNLAHATAADIRTLIHQIQDRVYADSGVRLEREQIFLPQDADATRP